MRERVELFFVTAGSEAFGGPDYASLVERDAKDQDVHVYFGYDLVAVRPNAREAVFRVTKGNVESESVLAYDLLHVVPPMRAPEVVAASALACQSGPMKGYLEVDPDTLQHRRYRNVFGLGDVAGIASVKTGERARMQAALVTRTLSGLMEQDTAAGSG